MVKIKIAEINFVTLSIVYLVGIIGILSVGTYEQITIACVSGLVGYMGRFVQTKSKDDTETTYEESA